VGYRLPKGADVVLQVHYHRTGKEERDRTRLGLYFAQKAVARPHLIMAVPGFFTSIPAGADHYKVTGRIWIDQDITLYSVMPHMHLLGKEIKTTMLLPDGSRQPLVSIKDWDYNWQEFYYLKEPIKVPAGTGFEVEAFYDNSDKNPLNPHRPPQKVWVGEQTTNEMCFVFLGCAAEKPGTYLILPRLSAPKVARSKTGTGSN